MSFSRKEKKGGDMSQMSRTSQWAGYLASAFAIAFFVTVTAFYKSEQTPLNWLPTATALCMMLAAFSGVVCLVSAIFSSIRERRRPRRKSLELSRRAFKLDS
jgi:peptidoglycan/LPS O-acetylase OafA/YrhL